MRLALFISYACPGPRFRSGDDDGIAMRFDMQEVLVATSAAHRRVIRTDAVTLQTKAWRTNAGELDA